MVFTGSHFFISQIDFRPPKFVTDCPNFVLVQLPPPHQISNADMPHPFKEECYIYTKSCVPSCHGTSATFTSQSINTWAK